MERQVSAFVAIVASLFIGQAAFAQAAIDPTAPATQPGAVSDDELQTFADIYSDLQASKTKHEAQLATAKTDEEAGKIQADFQQESVAMVSKHGWTLDKFNSVVRTINADPALAEKASALIKD
jgi:hypothetical protein